MGGQGVRHKLTLVSGATLQLSSHVVVVCVPWLWAWGGCTIMCCRVHICIYIYIYIYIYTFLESGVLFLFYCTVLWCVQIIEYIIGRWSYSFDCILHCRIIISMQTCSNVLNIWNTRQVHPVKCVSKNKSVLSTIFHATYGAESILLTQLSYDECVNMCTMCTIIIKSEVCPICQCLGLGHEAMVCAACLSIFLQWCHFQERYGVSNHRQLDFLFDNLPIMKMIKTQRWRF